MRIKEKVVEGVVVVSIAGKMMGGPEQEECHSRIKELLEDNMKWVVLDMGKVEWLNSSGLGLLMSCYTSCCNAGGDMVIARATRKVNSLFMLTQVIKVFDTFETTEEAIEEMIKKKEI